jgi:hypothetical protein
MNTPGYTFNGITYPYSDKSYYVVPNSCSCCFVTIPFSNAVQILEKSPTSYGFGRVKTANGVKVGLMIDETNPFFRYFDDNENLVKVTSGNLEFLICENPSKPNHCSAIVATTTNLPETTTQQKTSTTVQPECGKIEKNNKTHQPILK